jgi:hypothetical protein
MFMRAVLLSLLIGSQTAVLIAILRRGLVRPFLCFGLYVLFLLVRQVRLCFLDTSDPEYLRFWALTLVLLIPLQILAVGESAYRSLQQFKGLSSSILAGSLGVAVVSATWIGDLQTRQTHFGVFSQADQAVSTAVFLSGLAMSLALSWINPRRSRMVLLHERLLLFHFGLLATSLFLLHHGAPWANRFFMPLSAAGFFAWAWLIRPGDDTIVGYDFQRPGAGAPPGRDGGRREPRLCGGAPPVAAP